jgi:hypothetical protein
MKRDIINAIRNGTVVEKTIFSIAKAVLGIQKSVSGEDQDDSDWRQLQGQVDRLSGFH